MEAWKIIQPCEHNGTYSKEDFIRLIKHTTQEEFNRFCREYWALLYFYDSNVNSFCTNQESVIKQHPKSFRRLEPIDTGAVKNLEKII